MVGPDGSDAGSFQIPAGYGANLRSEIFLSRSNQLYDSRTFRFDSPYQQGDCGGEGSCGTCTISVLEGADILNERVRVEDMAMKKQVRVVIL